MRGKPFIRMLVLLALPGFSLACSDGPLEPLGEIPFNSSNAFFDSSSSVSDDDNNQADNGGGNDLPPGTVMQWTTLVPNDITRTQVCGSRGCTIEISSLGFELKIPRHALSMDTEITATALAGEEVNFEFEPHGTQFNRSVNVSVDVSLTSVTDPKTAKFNAWYWIWDADENPAVIDVIDATYKKGVVAFKTDHFSGYAMAF